MNLGPIAKAVNGTVVATLGVLVVVLQNGITLPEWLTLAGTAVASSQAIFWVANGGRFGPYAKAIASAVTTGLGVVTAALLAGQPISVVLVLTGVLAALNGGLIVPQTPNAEESDNLIVHEVGPDDEEEHTPDRLAEDVADITEE